MMNEVYYLTKANLLQSQHREDGGRPTFCFFASLEKRVMPGMEVATFRPMDYVQGPLALPGGWLIMPGPKKP